MSSYSHQYYSTASSGAVPIPGAVPGKNLHYHRTTKYQYPSYYASNESTYSVSPPEDLEASLTSSSSGSGGGMASYGNSSYSVTASYAGSIGQAERDPRDSAMGGIDLNDYMQERFSETFDPLPLDRCTAKQAQTSGHLNAKHRELLELQAKAQARLAKTRARFAQGLEDAREVHNDLEWTQKKVSSLQSKASKKHSKEYTKARARYPSPPSF